MFKKLVSVTLVLTMILSMGVIGFAEQDSYTYKKGKVKINSNFELNDSDLKKIVEDIENGLFSNETTDNNGGISTYAHDIGGGNGTIIDGPYYQHFTNKDVEAGATILANGLYFETGYFTVSKWIDYLVFPFLSGIAINNVIDDSYVGTWNYKYYSDYHDKYIYCGVVVHYKDSGFDEIEDFSMGEYDRKDY